MRTPPKIAKFLLRVFSNPEQHYAYYGDIEEMFNDIFEETGAFKAHFWYWGQVLKVFPQFIADSLYGSMIMLKNYFTITLRNIKKHKAHTLINSAGLAIGLACCILIIIYIHFELSYDKYHENSERVYRVLAHFTVGGQANPIPVTSPPVGPALKREFPEVLDAVRIYPMNLVTPKVPVSFNNNQFFEDHIFYADNSIFNIFTFPMISGNPETALSTAFSAVITEEIAEKYFREENPLGKILKFNNRAHYTVTGVVKNIPKNSHFSFDILCSIETLNRQRGEQMESWNAAMDYYAYILLNDNFNYRDLEGKFPALIERYAGEWLKANRGKLNFYLQPLTSIHLHSHMEWEIEGNSDIKYIYLFAAIALFILLIACINFMNLSTARSTARAKEVGIRKVMGSDRRTLISQFLVETLIYSFISFLCALLLVRVALSVFKTLANIELTIGYSQIPWLIPGFIGLILFVGLIAGSYPAFFLSGFQPAKVLKGGLRAGPGNSRFRNILVVIQFTISIALIIGTGIISSQLNYMKNRKLGFNKEHVIILPLMGANSPQSFNSFKETLHNYNGIINVAASRNVPGEQPAVYFVWPEGFSRDEAQFMHEISIDYDFIPSIGIEIVAGRNFSPEFSTDTRGSVIINETAAKKFGWNDPIGKTIRGGRTRTVIGVVKDFHWQSLHKEIPPVLMSYMPGWYNSLSIRISPENISGTLSFVRKKWSEIYPQIPFDYYFLDESFDHQYRAEERLSEIFSYFTLFAIFIACLGLFGMTSYTTEQRTKEIGIRKVLGASTNSIVVLLSKEMVKLILLASIIAWLFVFFMSNKWLESFAYRTSINASTFILSTFFVFLIGFLTISYQSIKAALTNPVKSLRNE